MNVFNLNTTEIAAKVVALELVRVCVWVFSLFTSRECFLLVYCLLHSVFWGTVMLPRISLQLAIISNDHTSLSIEFNLCTRQATKWSKNTCTAVHFALTLKSCPHAHLLVCVCVSRFVTTKRAPIWRRTPCYYESLATFVQANVIQMQFS